MTTFAEQQAARDALMTVDHITRGISTFASDECRRWSTCDRCKHRSGEMRFLTEQLGWEDDHILYGCNAIAEPEVIDPDIPLVVFPDPATWTFTREYAELDTTTHVYRPLHNPYVSGRSPQAMPRKAA